MNFGVELFRKVFTSTKEQRMRQSVKMKTAQYDLALRPNFLLLY
jgi:hypothetical protein